jgi:hypothetical protein
VIGAAGRRDAATRELTDLKGASAPSKIDCALTESSRLRTREPTVCSSHRVNAACDGSSHKAQRTAAGDRDANEPLARKTTQLINKTP